MPRTPPSLAFPLLLLLACAHHPRPSQYGDIHEGPCRVDADCPQGEHCTAFRMHRWSSGEIVGDHVKHHCEAPEPADASTGD